MRRRKTLRLYQKKSTDFFYFPWLKPLCYMGGFEAFVVGCFGMHQSRRLGNAGSSWLQGKIRKMYGRNRIHGVSKAGM
jgi:hypothetical protein